MKKIRFTITIIILLSSGLFLVSCKSNNIPSGDVSLDFLITPEIIILHSNDKLIELNKVEDKAKDSIKSINEEYDDTSKISEEDIKIQEETHNELINIINSGEIIDNKSTIENIFNRFRELEGIYVDSFEEDVIVRIYSTDDTKIAISGSIDDPYLGIFNLLEDGHMIIPKPLISKFENTTTNKIEYIKVKLPDELRYELEKLAKD